MRPFPWRGLSTCVGGFAWPIASTVLRARLAAYSRWAGEDPVQGTAKARAAFMLRFIDAVDPSRELPELERLRRGRERKEGLFHAAGHEVSGCPPQEPGHFQAGGQLIPVEVERYRTAAREIVHADHRPRTDRLVMLCRLAASARRVDEWAQEAVWRASRAFIRGEPDPLPVGDPFTRAARRLRARGLERCPECTRRLPSLQALDREGDRRIRTIEQRRREEHGR
jgi:hypothetical protein